MPFDVAAHTVRLGPADAGEVLTLQLAAWVREAINNDTLAIPPLHEDVHDVEGQLTRADVTAWGLRDGGRLLAMVRTSPLAGGPDVFLGRLGVVPDRIGTGLGSAMLRLAEARLAPDVGRIELVTGIRSADNQRFYTRHGYQIVEWLPAEGIVRMAKDLVR